MNLLRTLTKEQLYHLKRLCEGDVVLLWDEEERRYMEQSGPYRMSIPHGNDRQRGRRGRSKRPWLGSVVVGLLQRKLLVDDDGRIMPSKAAAKLFGNPPPLPTPKKEVKMHRTRAARDQDAPPKQRRPKKSRDRTGQVWEHLGEPRLITGPARVESLSGARHFVHPSACLLEGTAGDVTEREGDPFEGKPGYKRLA